MRNIQIIWSGETELPAGWALQPHSHDFFHLAYVRKGQLVFHADEQAYPLSPGSLILFPPGSVHSVPKDTHNLCVQYEVLFRIPDPEQKALFADRQVLVLHDASHLESLFSYIWVHYRNTDPLCVSCVESFLSTILLSFLADKPSSEGSSNGYVDSGGYSPLVQRILSHVEKNYSEKYDLPSLARSLGFNKNYLCTAFRRETGITISDYINYNRIRKMLVTLQYNGYNKDFPIHEMAYQFGYVNTSYFNRVFKKYTGMTPTEFMSTLSGAADSAERSAFQEYYNEFLDLKRHPIQESLEYMRGLKTALEKSKLPDDPSVE